MCLSATLERNERAVGPTVGTATLLEGWDYSGHGSIAGGLGLRLGTRPYSGHGSIARGVGLRLGTRPYSGHGSIAGGLGLRLGSYMIYMTERIVAAVIVWRKAAAAMCM